MHPSHRSLISLSVIGQFTLATSVFGSEPIPEVGIELPPLPSTMMSSEQSQLRRPDSGELIKSLPGAALNSNGPLTTLVQYRGASGDRVNVSIDGATFTSGGPNKMDSALSYIPGALLDKVAISRGIASVSKGQETLGGHVSASSYHPAFADSQQWQFSGRANSLMNSNGEGHSSGLSLFGSNKLHRIGITASHDKGNDSDFGSSNTLANSHFERSRYNLHYGYQNQDQGLNFMAGRNKTQPTGTAALPMDINFIDTDLLSFTAYSALAGGTLDFKISYADVDHSMDNFSQRPAPNMTMMMNGMPMSRPMMRATRAQGENLAWKLSYRHQINSSELLFGLDSNNSEHDARISDPSNNSFSVINFNAPSRDVLGAYAQWKYQQGAWGAELGLRHNTIKLDAKEVSFNGMMGMAGANANTLAQAFNFSDRSQQHSNTDAVAKLGYKTQNDWAFYVGLANKTRAPSYQEVYLWLPMQATGGLADGRNYIGNLDLNSEEAKEINLTADWRNRSAYVASQVFFRKVDDYIQGTQLQDPRAQVPSELIMAANMASQMMGAKAALQFNNVDAELYGADISYGVSLNAQWHIDGVLSYVRGRRTDINDNLYRIAPLNHRLSLSYLSSNYQLILESVAASKQDKTSAVNDEKATAGYGIVNLRGQWQLANNLELVAGIDNMSDKRYQDHLAGYNRVSGARDLALGERLYGLGRSIYLGFNYPW